MMMFVRLGRNAGLLAALALVGCGGDTAGTAKATGKTGTGGATGATNTGATPKTDVGGAAAKADKKDDHDHDHDHEHGDGPHGGVVFDLGGGKYHAEFTVSHPKQEAVVYVLEGGNEKKAAPVKASSMLLSVKSPAFQVELKPLKQARDPEGAASAFAGKHERLGKEQEFEGTVSLEIDGKPYAGDFKEVAHGHDKK